MTLAIIYLTGYIAAYFFIKLGIRQEGGVWSRSDRAVALSCAIMSWLVLIPGIVGYFYKNETPAKW